MTTPENYRRAERCRDQREREALRRRPLFDEDKIAKAHAAYLKEQAHRKAEADRYGIVRVNNQDARKGGK